MEAKDTRKKRYSYTIKTKLAAISYYKQCRSYKQTARVFNVDKKCIKDWISKETLLRNAPNKGERKTLHRGRRQKLMSEKEEDIVRDFLEEKLKNKAYFTKNEVLQFLLSNEEISPKLKDKSYVRAIDRITKEDEYIKYLIPSNDISNDMQNDTPSDIFNNASNNISNSTSDTVMNPPTL